MVKICQLLIIPPILVCTVQPPYKIQQLSIAISKNQGGRCTGSCRPDYMAATGWTPQSSTHVFRINVEPVLLFGFEVSPLPVGRNLETLEIYLRSCLKQLLTPPRNTSTPAIYILAGYLPVDSLIHKRAVSLFGNVCRLPETAVEKQLAFRQLSVKSIQSSSWYIQIGTILLKYNLPPALDLLSSAYTKFIWKKTVRYAVHAYWVNKITTEAGRHKSLQFLNTQSYIPGKSHPLLHIVTGSTRKASRIHARLLVATGTYYLQTNRAAFRQCASDAICLLCGMTEETLFHFLLECPSLGLIRGPIMQEILDVVHDVTQSTGQLSIGQDLTQLIVDCTVLTHTGDERGVKPELLQRLQNHSGRLVYGFVWATCTPV